MKNKTFFYTIVLKSLQLIKLDAINFKNCRSIKNFKIVISWPPLAKQKIKHFSFIFSSAGYVVLLLDSIRRFFQIFFYTISVTLWVYIAYGGISSSPPPSRLRPPCCCLCTTYLLPTPFPNIWYAPYLHALSSVPAVAGGIYVIRLVVTVLSYNLGITYLGWVRGGIFIVP